MDLSVIIPVYCSEEIIDELHRRLLDVLTRTQLSFEIIYIDDSSTDNSWQKIENICKNNSTIGISMGKNYGQHNCVFCGIKNANGKYIITMDDDLQHPPEEIPKLTKYISKNYDVVYAVPKVFKHSFFRNISTKITKTILDQVMGSTQARNINSFRIFKRSLMTHFFDLNNSNVNIDVLLSWATNKFGSIKVNHELRKYGQSKYTTKKLLLHTIRLVTNFSALPLKLASILGLLFSLFGFIILMSVLINYILYGSPVQGFPFLASIISIFSGVQLFTLGIFGEYIATIHSKSISRPAYVVRKILNKK